MPSFGISAFLRIVHMNPRPQRSELRRRLTPREGGYDFHSSLRRLAYRLLVDGESLENILAATGAIVQEPERRSAQTGLRNLIAWRTVNPGPILRFEPVTFRSPSETFGVTFTPNFGLLVEGQSVAVHVWNTAVPRLEPRLVRAVLSLFVDAYHSSDNPPDDLAILCLRTMRLIRLGNVADVAPLGLLIASSIDGIFREVERELREPPPGPFDQPPAPPIE